MSIRVLKLVLIALAAGSALALLVALSTSHAVKAVARPISVQSPTSPNDIMSKTFASNDMTWTVSLPSVIYQPVPTIVCTDVVGNGNFEAPAPGRPWTGVAN